MHRYAVDWTLKQATSRIMYKSTPTGCHSNNNPHVHNRDFFVLARLVLFWLIYVAMAVKGSCSHGNVTIPWIRKKIYDKLRRYLSQFLWVCAAGLSEPPTPLQSILWLIIHPIIVTLAIRAGNKLLTANFPFLSP